MNILADTNIWCDYFRQGNETLSSLLEYDFLVIHPLVIGELCVGNLPHRQRTVKDLMTLPTLQETSYQETHTLLESHELWGKGIQWNDLVILASALTSPGTLLWTQDKRLSRIAADFSIQYHPR